MPARPLDQFGHLVTVMLDSLCTSAQSTDANAPTWSDRAVLVEASFVLRALPTINLKGDVPQDVLTTLLPARGALQSLRMRFRISDARTSGKTWNLGFKLLGTGMGVTLRSLDQAGAEGIVDLETVWFDGTGSVSAVDGRAAYEAEGSVPPVTLFCQ